MPQNKALSGYVCLAHALGTIRFKIGRASNADKRLSQLNTSSPYPVRIVGKKYVGDVVAEEKKWHEIFGSTRRHGEWFELSVEQLSKIARKLKAKIDVHFKERQAVEHKVGIRYWVSCNGKQPFEVELLERA